MRSSSGEQASTYFWPSTFYLQPSPNRFIRNTPTNCSAASLTEPPMTSPCVRSGGRTRPPVRCRERRFCVEAQLAWRADLDQARLPGIGDASRVWIAWADRRGAGAMATTTGSNRGTSNAPSAVAAATTASISPSRLVPVCKLLTGIEHDRPIELGGQPRRQAAGAVREPRLPREDQIDAVQKADCCGEGFSPRPGLPASANPASVTNRPRAPCSLPARRSRP